MPLTISLRPYQNPTDGKKSLNALPYVVLPPWRELASNVTIGYSTIQAIDIFNILNLTSFVNWHASNASSIYSTFVPSSYFYAFDGVTSTSILEGGVTGTDMYDTGNFISISTNRGATRVFSSNSNVYGILSTLSNQNFGYTITSRNIWPQVSLAFIKEGSISWRVSGGIGSDNLGQLSNVSSFYSTNRGFTGRFWANQGWGQSSDPSICYTWFTIESTSWNTLISSSVNGMWNVAATSDPMNQSVQVTGRNFIFGMFLLSTRRPTVYTALGGVGFFLSTTFLANFLSNYVENAVINVT